MATRASIRIVDGDKRIDLYHHWDGYPEGVGVDLVKYCGKIDERMRWRIDNIANDLVKGKIVNIEAGQEVPDMGYEISYGFHADIEYAYLIDCVRKKVFCHEIGWEEEYSSLNEIFAKAKVVEIPSK